MNNVLSTDRFYFREFMENDWPAVHRYASQEQVSRYQPWGPNTEEESKNYVREIVEGAAKPDRTQFAFAIIWKESDHLIGAGELSIQDSANRVGEIGYIVHPEYWGRGIATEAAQLLIRYGFDEWNLHRIFATCDPNNTGSQKVLEKVGMVYEGRLRENVRLKNGWRDSMVFSVLKQEWKE